jgi:hypothetical protein
MLAEYLEFANHYCEESYFSQKSPGQCPHLVNSRDCTHMELHFTAAGLKPISQGRGAVTFTT